MTEDQDTAPRTPRQIAAWLSNRPPLEQMQNFFPDEWTGVQEQAARLLQHRDSKTLSAQLEVLAAPLSSSPDRMRAHRDLALAAVRREMLLATLRGALLRHEAGVERGPVRFGLVNGWVLQRLLFQRGLRRRSVNYPVFRLVWPLVPQRQRLMPLVMEQGIYCFYTGRLLKQLKQLIAGRSCLEIAAGDGTLSRLLSQQGVTITATDDQSWGIDADRQQQVENLDARGALRRYDPAVVVCSWPPPGNDFERHVFDTASVELYIVITSRKEYAASNWAAYREQTAFSMEDLPDLGRLVVPSATDACVLAFRRLPTSPGLRTRNGQGSTHLPPSR